MAEATQATNLTARLTSTLFVKSIVIWIQNRNNDLSTLQWLDPYIALENYLYPVDSHRRAHNKLENCKKKARLLATKKKN